MGVAVGTVVAGLADGVAVGTGVAGPGDGSGGGSEPQAVSVVITATVTTAAIATVRVDSKAFTASIVTPALLLFMR